ncbi:MAG: cell envelope integrity protein TolA [Proteobacteria bacterium]|nr:cell envelope integrity protein TolA [Pseudomonadota bacterium]
MHESNQSPNRSSGIKGPVVIIIVGVVVLVAAGLILLNKRVASPNPTVRVNQVVGERATAAPLVITEPARPLNGGREDDKSPDQGRKAKQEPLGNIDPRVVNRFINARFGQVKACYERRLRTDSSLEGKLDLNISISPTGRVTSVTVNRDTVKDTKMRGCVRQTIRKWDFPKPTGGRVVVAKTFHFKKKF